jgi:hypothetical protein
MDVEALRHELEALRIRIKDLETQLSESEATPAPPRAYWTYEVAAGCVLGMMGAATSLLFNIVGSLVVGQDPLELIRIYLTFPLADQAFELKANANLVLAIGCCLYLGTGMFLGVPIHLALRRVADRVGGRLPQLAAATLMGLALWLINFYGILSWLQPLLFGGNWIVERVPWWVGAATHLVFAWTIWIAGPLGVFRPYVPRAEAA